MTNSADNGCKNTYGPESGPHSENDERYAVDLVSPRSGKVLMTKGPLCVAHANYEHAWNKAVGGIAQVEIREWVEADVAAELAAEQDPREARLPQWAQDRLKQLHDSVAYWKQREQVRILAIGDRHPGAPNTFVDQGLRDEHIPLGQGTRIAFRLGGDRRPMHSEIRVHVDRQSGMVEVNGDDRLVIEPQSGNHIRITLGT